MKKLVIVLGLIRVLSFANAQQSYIFSQLLRTADKDSITDMLVMPNGKILILGIKEQSGQTDAYLCNISQDGTLNWCNTYGTTANDYAYGISMTGYGMFIIAGQTFITDPDSGDAFVIKLDTSGNIQWQRVLRNPYRDAFYDVAFLPSQGFISAVGFTSELVFCEASNNIMVNFFDDGTVERLSIPYAASCNYDYEIVKITECPDYIYAYSQVYNSQYNQHYINVLSFDKTNFSIFATTLTPFPSPYENIVVTEAACESPPGSPAFIGFMDYSPGSTPIKKVAFFNTQFNRYHFIVGDSSVVLTSITIDTASKMMYIGGYTSIRGDTLPFIAKRNITTNSSGYADSVINTYLIVDSLGQPLSRSIISSIKYLSGSLIISGNTDNSSLGASKDNLLLLYDTSFVAGCLGITAKLNDTLFVQDSINASINNYAGAQLITWSSPFIDSNSYFVRQPYTPTQEFISITGLQAHASVQEPLCNGDSSGSISLTISGGNPPYTTVWNTGDTSNSLDNIPAGSYSAFITDNQNCSRTINILLSEPPPLTIYFDVYPGDSAIVVNAQGGTPPYSFLWNTGSLSDTLKPQTSGIYIVTATDNNGCTLQDSVAIVLPLVVSSAENPVLEQCHLHKRELKCSKHFEIIIRDLSGRVLNRSNNGIMKFKYSGFYLIEIIGDDKRELFKIWIP